MKSNLLIASSRLLRARAVAWLLLFAQATSLVVVPLHAIAHSHARDATGFAAATAEASGAIVLNRLLGHDQGMACDDWNAAFALDANPGDNVPVVSALLPSTYAIAFRPAVGPEAAPSLPFLARAPPRA